MKKTLVAFALIAVACAVAAVPRDRILPDPSEVVTAKAGDLWPVVLGPVASQSDKQPKPNRKRIIREGDDSITAGITKMNPSGGFGDITAFNHGDNGGGSGSVTNGSESSYATSAQKAGRMFVGCGYLVGAYGAVTSFGKDLSS